MGDSHTQKIKKDLSEKRRVYANFFKFNTVCVNRQHLEFEKLSINTALTRSRKQQKTQRKTRCSLEHFQIGKIAIERQVFFVLAVNIYTWKPPINTAFTSSGKLAKTQKKTGCSLEHFQCGKIASERQVFFVLTVNIWTWKTSYKHWI